MRVQSPELAQPLEIHQPGIRHACPAKVQLLELLQPGEMLQPGVRHGGPAEVEAAKLAQRRDGPESSVRDLRFFKAQFRQLVCPLQMR